MKKNIFMTGNWEHLILKSFSCDPEILTPYLPKNTELDLYKGKGVFSMIAFTFSKVKFFGIKVPFHQLFGEINFRFYVRSTIDGTKGVVFLKEYAPKPLIAFVANKIYNEPFYNYKVKREVFKTSDLISINYPFKLQGKYEKINALVTNKRKRPKEGSLAHFLVERYIAFVKSKRDHTYEYKIHRRPWNLLEVKKLNISNKILELLPKSFQNCKEVGCFVVEGSGIEVEKGILKDGLAFAF